MYTVWQSRSVRRQQWHHRPACQLFPVEQQRIARSGDHQSLLNAVIHGDDPILFDQRGAGEAMALRTRVDGVRKVAPVHQIRTHRVSPVYTFVAVRRIALIEEVPVSLPVAEAVGVVVIRFGTHEVVGWPVRITAQSCPRFVHARQKGVRRQLLLLRFERVAEIVFRCIRSRKVFRWQVVYRHAVFTLPYAILLETVT